MGVNEVIVGGETIINLKGDTVTPDTLAYGATAHSATGDAIVGTATFGAELLTGSTDEITPAQVVEAVTAGRPIYLTYTDSMYGVVAFTNFSAGISLGAVISSFILEYDGVTLGAFLAGDIGYGVWQFDVIELAKAGEIAGQKRVKAVNLSQFESNGKIVETYEDNSTVTYNFQFDSNKNPTKITDSNGNETVLTW